MDLCCGYGLLAVNILSRYKQVAQCHMVDADKGALSCAQKNTQVWQEKVHAHWLDATQLGLPKKLDWVVCNPPFHMGQTQDVTLGQGIVAQGCRSLKRGGHIYMVANRKLPYEHILEKHLRSYTTRVEQDGFKVIRGVR
jgi:16S rRNA (guanine1207-N2)-methyltransferase